MFSADRPIRTWLSPGRINVLGEHTDYHGGLVLPAAVDRFTRFAVQTREDGIIQAFSKHFGELVELRTREGLAPLRPGHWSTYLTGSLAVLGDILPDRGLNLGLDGDLPVGGGMSSSASLTVGFLSALREFLGLPLEDLELVVRARRVEVEKVGVNCGIMDQYAVHFSRARSFVALDCSALRHENVPLSDPEVILAVVDSGKHRQLTAGRYNEIVAECDAALAAINRLLGTTYSTLSQVPPREYDLPEPQRRRVRHVLGENERVRAGIEALREGRFDRFGALMLASQYSLAGDYGVSCEELDVLVEEAMQVEGVLGSKLSGAGLGGVTVTLLRREALQRFTERMQTRYIQRLGRTARVFPCDLVDGCAHRRSVEGGGS
ncbi:MAG: hypothetical protein A2284_06110 [Deltaproteobacteria bacterium RIFOXYA12_FULL_61_11]|nr:MAG: hypothetical protein A2284_06110 [Deltaproteobacteria bacterium RIFOXYA12_FULL_61_11]